MLKNKIKNKNLLKENRGGKRPGAGRPKTATGKAWQAVTVKAATKRKLEEIKVEKGCKNFDEVLNFLLNYLEL